MNSFSIHNPFTNLSYTIDMNIAVVGHLEWGRFARVSHLPVAGEIIHATGSWEEVAGGGSVAAMQLAQLNGKCSFFTAVGSDELGKKSIDQLRQNGVEVYASIDTVQPTKTITVHIDDNHERTITVIGNLMPNGNDVTLPWEKLAEMDAVYFVSGDKSALQHARKARQLVSTARIVPMLQESGILVDALLKSEKDSGEVYRSGDISPEPSLIITTQGANGGYLNTGERYEAEALTLEQIVDFYGCGDSFAAGIAYGLGNHVQMNEVLKIAAHAGAMAAQRRGVFGNR
jgi:ribokinase